jgi:cell migration-inducing and hyaluronan-binding protein
MRFHDRLLHLSLFATAFFTVSTQAQEAVRDGRWSDSSTWSGGDVPQAGDIVTIGESMDVVLDVSPPDLSGVNVAGKLSFSNDSDLELTTEWITLTGELEIGTEARRHTAKATITLTDNNPNEDMMAGMGDRGIMISGGTLNLHGNRTNAWTKLTATAEAGSSRIDVLNADQWQVGDEIVLASTDFDPRQAETRHITAISGNSITLDEPLQYMHYGEITFEVDQRGSGRVSPVVLST